MSAETRGLTGLTIPELGRLLRGGKTTATALATIALQRLEEDGRRLNAVVTLMPEIAMAQAERAETELTQGIDRGPLHGIPYGAKDLLATAGVPTTWGAAPLRDQHFDTDATVIQRLVEAGAVLVAKLAMVEFAGGFGYQQPDAALTGPGRNAWDDPAWAGGSSSGSGAAVAAGAVPFAIGSETWGSITTPACFNGVTGLRPTYGRVSRSGAMALSWSMDKLGPIARTAEDCALVLAAIAGPDPHDSTTLHHRPFIWPPPVAAARFRIATVRGRKPAADPEVEAAFTRSLETLRAIGSIEEIDLPDLPYAAAATTIIAAEAAAAFQEFLESGRAAGLTAPEDRSGLFHGLAIPAVDYLRALRIRRLAESAMATALAPFDALVAPTNQRVAPPLSARFDAYYEKSDDTVIGAADNLCGLPGLTVPNGIGDRGLPTGLTFIGRAGTDERLLDVASQYQSLTDWHEQRPPARMIH